MKHDFWTFNNNKKFLTYPGDFVLKPLIFRVNSNLHVFKWVTILELFSSQVFPLQLCVKRTNQRSLSCW
jgi:hypothetical protein